LEAFDRSGACDFWPDGLFIRVYLLDKIDMVRFPPALKMLTI
jgi:hypothetical protein